MNNKKDKSMKKLIFLTLLIGVFGSGCSMLPRLNFGTPGTVPQVVDKSKAKDICRGKAEFNENGDMISCSRGYFSYSENYAKKERKMTFTEKIKNFINNLVGASFWIFVLLIVLVPGLLGTVVGRMIEGTVGITGKALKSVVAGVQKARKQGKDLNDSLESETDNDVKKYIRELKERENIK